MKIMIVAGARPNFMKVGPILRAIAAYNSAGVLGSRALQPIFVHTGQHYDAMMSDAFFADLDLPEHHALALTREMQIAQIGRISGSNFLLDL